jgi:hypothetical protein
MKLRRTLVPAVLLFALAAPAARAEDKKPPEPGPWAFDAVAALNLAQSSFSSNWKGGDKGTIVWVLGGELTAQRQFSRRYHMQNVLKAAYGQTAKQQRDPADAARLVWDPPDKTTDLLAFESNSRWTLEAFVDPYLSVGAETQFQDESSPIGIIRFNPIKVKESAGAARVLKKTEDTEWITRLGFGFRQTFAQAFTDPVTEAKRSFTTNDGGFEWQTTATQPLFEKKVLYKGRLLVFQPVFFSKSGDLETMDAAVVAAYEAANPGQTRESVKDFWRATDIDLQNTFTAQITKLLAVNLFAQFTYDKFDAAANVDPSLAFGPALAELDRNTRKAGQFKQTLALALTYTLF